MTKIKKKQNKGSLTKKRQYKPKKRTPTHHTKIKTTRKISEQPRKHHGKHHGRHKENAKYFFSEHTHNTLKKTL